MCVCVGNTFSKANTHQKETKVHGQNGTSSCQHGRCVHAHCCQGGYLKTFRLSGITRSAMQLVSVLIPLVLMLWMTGLGPCHSNPAGCRLWTEPQPPGIFMDGDFVIGGIFSIHYFTRSEQTTYTRLPEKLQCSGRSVTKHTHIKN